MRLGFLALPASVLCLLACASSSSSGPGGSNGPSTGTPGGTGAPAAADAPLVAHAVCSTVTTGDHFGSGCSGTAEGESVCALEDSYCGADKCVYDSRGSTFSFTCAPTCTVGDSTVCPLGYECVAPDASCSSGAKGVCAARSNFTCDGEDSSTPSGSFFEGPAGEVLLFARGYGDSKSTLSVRKGKTFTELLTWADEDATISATAKSSDSLLIVTGKNEILVKNGEAALFPHPPTTSYSTVYSSAKDGSFVRLEPQGSTAGYAALSKRAEDGTWSDVGPTKQKIASLHALNSGFIARCGDALCTSPDGETFTSVTLPDGVTLPTTNPANPSSSSTPDVVAAGLSPDEFWVVIAGALYHQRKGSWVTEGPKANAAPAADAGSSGYNYPDSLRVSSSGTVVYNTYDYTKHAYATYVSGDSCWAVAGTGNLDNATLVKDTFVYRSDSAGYCTRPTK